MTQQLTLQTMAFIAILARHKTVSKFQLRGPTTLGRSMDCDIYIPDVFVSREHCSFVQRDGHWHIVDAQSRNGIWREGKRAQSYLLKPGDIIEIGTIAMQFNAGDPEGPSHPAPLGMGPGVTELMDTVFAHDLRPSQYSKKQKARAKEWKQRVKSRLAERPEDYDFEPMPVIDPEPWRPEEWAELDLELQIATGQDQMTHWQPPIFNPKRQTTAATGAGAPAGTASAATLRQREPDFIDEKVKSRSRAPAAPPVEDDYKGIKFVSYTWRDRLYDEMKERLAATWAFAKLNPQVAAAIAIGIAVLLYAAVKVAPIKSGPHYYVDPEAAVAQTTR